LVNCQPVDFAVYRGLGGSPIGRPHEPQHGTFERAILWASTLALSAWLVSSGVTGAFGIAASNASTLINQVQQSPTAPAVGVTAQQARDLADNAAKVSWSFVFGSLLGLVSALAGSAAGCRTPRSVLNDGYAAPIGSRD
jgi:hypothetical protein